MHRVLVVGPSWIGDMVLAQSLFESLRRGRPGIRLDVLAPGWSRGILGRMPQVDRAIEMPLGHGQLGLGVRRRLGRSLRARRYEQAIVLPRSFKSALVPLHARIPRRTGYRGENRYGLINDMRRLDETLLPQVAQRYVALGAPADAPLPPEVPAPRLRIDERNRRQRVAELDLAGDGPTVGLVPGAQYGPAKRWPVEHFGELAGRLVDRGARVWIFGGERDRDAGRSIARATAGRAVDLTGRTRIEDVVDLLSLVDVAVTNDTGLLHVAGAVGAHVVALYGSSSPAYTPPLTEKRTVLYRGLDCSPCFARTCRFGHYRCLTEIRPAAVATAIDEVLDRPAGYMRE